MADAAQLISGVRYLVPGWIPLGMVTGIVAEPGIGKSAFALWLAQSVLLGTDWFTGDPGPPPGRVMWIDTENTTALTVERMKEWDIPMESMVLPFENTFAAIDLGDRSHFERVIRLIEQRQIELVVVDSLRGGHGGDENSSGAMSAVMGNLSVIAQRTGAAVVVVHHTKKLAPDEELTANSSRGSNAVFAMMRCQLGIDRPNPADKTCRIRVLKENLGVAPEPLGFRITPTGLGFVPAPTRPKRRTTVDDAVEFLRDEMTPGEWVAATEILERAESEHGLSKPTVQRARKKVGIIKPENVQKVAHQWQWRLPGGKS